MAKYRKHGSPATPKRRRFRTDIERVAEGRSYVDALALAKVQAGLQEALEVERDEIVGRAWHRHHVSGEARQYRNGYGDPRYLTCGCGRVQLALPRLRQPYESAVVQKYERLTPDVQRLIPELYLRGLATGDFEQAFGWLWGEEAPLSPTTVARLKGSWEAEYGRWKNQPLDAEYLYVWADGIYPKGGPLDETLALLVVVGVDRRGRKRLLALEEGYRESDEAWTDLFRTLRRRGVSWIGLVVGDGLNGLWKAVRKVYPQALHQRCWVHKMRNVLDKVPEKVQDEVREALREIYHAPTRADAIKLRRQFTERYRRQYPNAVTSLLEPGESLFTYFLFPRVQWIHIKTTNPLESIFSTVRLRTRAARRMRSRIGAVCLVFQLLRHSERRLRRIRGWSRVADTIDALRKSHLRPKIAA